MKSITKRASALLIVVAVFATIFVGWGIVFEKAFAQTSDDAYKYYYNHLSKDPLAQSFYKAYEDLMTNGEFKKGSIEYDLVANNVATQEQIMAYVNGTSQKLAKSFGAGRDAFYMDHPDLFYADVFSTSISAGQQGDKYVAYLDSSRSVTTYLGELNTADKIDAAVQTYESKLNEIVAGANKKATVKEKIEYVNDYIISHNNYGWGTVVEGDKNVDTPKASFIYTSYGALINNESVCEGYAKSLKAVLDRLSIPCVLVQGYVKLKTNNYEPHMWNYVQVDGQWYMVDATMNSESNNEYMLVGGNAINDKYLEDNVVSSSGYELLYPVLKPYNYGSDEDANGMSVIGKYTLNDDNKRVLSLTVSYDGKGAKKLEEEGKYLAYRYSYGNYDKDINWSFWMNCLGTNEAFNNNLFAITDYDTTINVDSTTEYYQFALVDYPPDSNPYDSEHVNYMYSDEQQAAQHFIVNPTTPYRNDGYTPTDNPAPGAVNFYPANTGDLPVDRTYELKVSYNTELKLVDEKQPVDLTFTVSAGSDSIEGNAFISDVKWDGDRTITFKFTPSKMYIHNMASYFFTPTNLVGALSDKAPDPFRYTFKGKSVVCGKVFNDGRLYMNVFGKPKMLDDSDISVTDFKDENGKYYAASQRSQLMLVASKPSTDKAQKMDEVLKQETGVKDDEIIASASYEIDLQICGLIRQVPNGSYMQVSFGFPEGYSPEDKGTTFKIYHYKHDNKGNITGVEEIPVIVTEYGLIAKVTSFSPFTIVQVKNTSLAVTNGKSSTNVYACVNGGKGGTVTTNGKSGIAEVTGDTITYDIKADAGYTVGSVRLNGKVLSASDYKNGKLTLAKKDIEDSNMLEVTFVTQSSAKSYADKGITLSYQIGNGGNNNKTAGIVIGCIAAVVVLAGAGFAAWWFLIKNKQPAKASASATATASKKTATSKKTTATKSTTSDSKSKAKNSTAATKSSGKTNNTKKK